MGSSLSPCIQQIIQAELVAADKNTDLESLKIIMGNLRDAILPRIGPLFRDCERIMVVNNSFIRPAIWVFPKIVFFPQNHPF